MQSTSCEMPGWMKHKLKSRFPGEISITSDMQMTAPLWQKNEEEQKRLLMKVKEENEKPGLKLNIQKMKSMASSPITSWQIDGETMETVIDFILGAPKSLRRRQWHPTPVLLPGKSYGLRSLVGCNPWGR